ncbi:MULTISPECIES: hypothetical protein [Flavobacterium]|uniref:hypothetical protein n=1 Tax=Flavobacterium TaxID=237 RepID=UPI0011840648|nr:MULTISPECIES: hypothetical protein [Flavobacterium]MCR4029310.1 hypothetical protein [Flavobacterium panacis]
MTKIIIENLKILSENFKHKFDTFSDTIIFVNEVNKIRIRPENNTNFRITYNLCLDEKTILVSKETIYHFVLELFKRKDTDTEVNSFHKKTIDIEEWFKIEKEESLNIISEIEKELDYNYRLKYLILETKRFEITYFNGLLILEDKQKEYSANVFNFRNIAEIIQ